MSEIRTTHELIDAAMSLVGKWGHEVWWRGHGINDWPLTPTLYRQTRTQGYETNVALRFKRAATTRHRRCPAPDDYAGWSFLAQHYRLPTRLLDWTESPLIALVFAVRDESSEPGALWALNPFSFNQQQIGEAVVLNPLDPAAQALIRPAFDPAAPQSKRLLAVYPEEVDIRLSVQLSAFTLHGTATPLEHLPRVKQFLIRFTIPADAKQRLREELDTLGIRRANIFPDLENLAAQLATLEF